MSAKYAMMVATVDPKRPKETFWSTVKNTNGTDWGTEDIADVKTKYQELLQTTPASNIMPIHVLDVDFNIAIDGCEPEIKPEEPGPEAPTEPVEPTEPPEQEGEA